MNTIDRKYSSISRDFVRTGSREDAVFEDSMTTPSRVLQVPRGTRYPRTYLIIKHLLLAILFLMVIWTLLKIPLAEQYIRNKMSPDMPESSILMIKSIVIVARVLVVVLCFFGIFGIIKESFSLSLVFAVFMFIRLVGTIYVPYFNNGAVSTGLMCIITLLSFVFLSLVRRTDSDPSDSVTDSSSTPSALHKDLSDGINHV
jgi:hypothetical protein